MKGGHFDKACELSWAQGNLWTNRGLAELLKNFFEPQRAMSFLTVPRGSTKPEQLCWARAHRECGGQHIPPQLLSF